MNRIPAHVTASQAISEAKTLFLAAALRHLHAKCRDREIKKANILPAARHETDVFEHELVRRLSSGGYDDYCI